MDRPALAGVFPTVVKGTPVVVVDVGANVDCSPRMLAQFAVMGEIYSRMILRRPKPRVGLLSIGEEEHKGNELTRAATPLLEGLNLNFVGNVEGRDIYSGNVDVIVCDGFIGNVALKVSEGLVDMVKHLLRESLEATISGKIGYAHFQAAPSRISRSALDYSEYGGAPLLGVRGVCIICHGRSNANAIKNAIRVAAEFSEGKVNQRIEEELRGQRARCEVTAINEPLARRYLREWRFALSYFIRLRASGQHSCCPWSLRTGQQRASSATRPATAAPGQALARGDVAHRPGLAPVLRFLRRRHSDPFKRRRRRCSKARACCSRRPSARSMPVSARTPKPTKATRPSCWKCSLTQGCPAGAGANSRSRRAIRLATTPSACPGNWSRHRRR